MVTQDLYVGLDIGSATVKVAAVDRHARMVGDAVYLRHDAFVSPGEAVKHALSTFLQATQGNTKGIGVTGSGRELYKRLVGADCAHTEIFAHAAGVSHLVSRGAVADSAGQTIRRAGTIIEIGGQDAKVIVLGKDGLPQHFNMNSICAAGTGEFLKQLADEAGITQEEFGHIALGSQRPATIDATCTVFSKRDFRHLTQKGVPLADRLMGVCHALVRNYLTNVVRGQALTSPILFQGGVASNPAVRRAFTEQLGSPVVQTPHNGVVGALGMAVIVRGRMTGELAEATNFRPDFAVRQVRTRVRYCHGCPNACDLAQAYEETEDGVVLLDTLGGRCDGSRNPRHVHEQPRSQQNLQVEVYRSPRDQSAQMPDLINPACRLGRSSVGQWFAGIDGGSRGTKYALVRGLGRHCRGMDVEIVTAGSVDTAGDAIAACLEALRRLRQALPPDVELAGLCTTGSAGELFRDMLMTPGSREASGRCTEIIAHYVWASYAHPQVRSVVDIGGNDAKLIAVRQGGLDFAMNDKCAAGTGAFLEAVARRFNVPIAEYGRVALEADHPARVAGRCAVFGESDIVHKARLGFRTADLFLGAAHAICRTYLSDLGRGMLEVPIVAQGGVFLNDAVRRAFRDILQLGPEELVVSEHPDHVLCAGALGAALVARGRWEQGRQAEFKGFEHALRSEFRTVTATCRHEECRRRCPEVVALLEKGHPIAGYKAIDCRRGYFSGLIVADGEREHVERMLLGRETCAPSLQGSVSLGG